MVCAAGAAAVACICVVQARRAPPNQTNKQRARQGQPIDREERYLYDVCGQPNVDDGSVQRVRKYHHASAAFSSSRPHANRYEMATYTHLSHLPPAAPRSFSSYSNCRPCLANCYWRRPGRSRPTPITTRPKPRHGRRRRHGPLLNISTNTDTDAVRPRPVQVMGSVRSPTRQVSTHHASCVPADRPTTIPHKQQTKSAQTISPAGPSNSVVPLANASLLVDSTARPAARPASHALN